VYAVADGGQAVDVAAVLGGQDLYLALECGRRPMEVPFQSDRATFLLLG
jgi:hypothetical protein